VAIGEGRPGEGRPGEHHYPESSPPSLLENGGVHADLEFPKSEHANRQVGPENIGLHILFVSKGSRGGELPPNHSL